MQKGLIECISFITKIGKKKLCFSAWYNWQHAESKIYAFTAPGWDSGRLQHKFANHINPPTTIDGYTPPFPIANLHPRASAHSHANPSSHANAYPNATLLQHR
jgi:hypothetical protein